MVDAVLGASRVLVSVAARSLLCVEGAITLPQFRVLVLLSSRGPQRVVDLAGALDAEPSTATRLCDRLVRKKLVRRQRLVNDRRTVQVAIADSGEVLVAEVMGQRKAAMAAILQRVSVEDQDRLVDALRSFNEAAGEVPEHAWSLGWDT